MPKNRGGGFDARKTQISVSADGDFGEMKKTETPSKRRRLRPKDGDSIQKTETASKRRRLRPKDGELSGVEWVIEGSSQVNTWSGAQMSPGAL